MRPGSPPAPSALAWCPERPSRAGGEGEGAHAPWRLLRRGGGAGRRGGSVPPFSGEGAGAALSAASAGEAGRPQGTVGGGWGGSATGSLRPPLPAAPPPP